MKRREIYIERFRRYPGCFACPVCGEGLSIREDPSPALACANNHSFDFAKQGYVNLLLCTKHRSKEPGYTRDMFEARRRVVEQGFFAPLGNLMAKMLQDAIKARGQSFEEMLLLDVGSGEGALLDAMLGQLQERSGVAPMAVGFDIAKRGAQMACQMECEAMWLVANAKRGLPLRPDTTDLLCNILAPDDFPGFAEILHNDGLLLKVVPGEHHLIEIRQAIYENPRKRPLGFHTIRDAFEEHFEILHTEELTYTLPVSEGLLPDLLSMNPLFWKANREKMAILQENGLEEITGNFDVVLGRKKCQIGNKLQ